MKKLFIIFFIIAGNLHAQQPDKEGSLVKWLTLKEAMQKVKESPKPVLIDFYTDWCGWCKTMMKTTYANPELANYINTFFYPAKFDAEGKDTVEYLGQKYAPVSDQPRTPHPLAIKLLNSKLMYPTTLFLNGYDKEKDEFKVNMIANGYLDQPKIEPILIFIVENAGRNSNYDDFRENFEKTFYDTTFVARQKKLTWLSPSDAFQKNSVTGKKTIILINTPWCTSCKVMKATSFLDSTDDKFLAEKFQTVDFNPEVTDTILFKGQKYFNPKDPRIPFHQLALLLGRNSISFPSLIILDENSEIIDVIPSYIPPSATKRILHFYGENIYKEKTWADFLKEQEKGKSN